MLYNFNFNDMNALKNQHDVMLHACINIMMFKSVKILFYSIHLTLTINWVCMYVLYTRINKKKFSE